MATAPFDSGAGRSGLSIRSTYGQEPALKMVTSFPIAVVQSDELPAGPGGVKPVSGRSWQPSASGDTPLLNASICSMHSPMAVSSLLSMQSWLQLLSSVRMSFGQVATLQLSSAAVS